MDMVLSINMTHITTIADKYPAKAKTIQALLFITLVLFVVGIWMPILTISKLWILTDEVSILGGLWQLLEEGQYFIFLLIFVFSIVLPVAKLYYLFMLSTVNKVSSDNYSRYLHLMHRYGRWSMLDVFVVAILIVTVKLGALADIEIEAGLYFFTAAVVLLMLITSLVVSMQHKLEMK